MRKFIQKYKNYAELISLSKSSPGLSKKDGKINSTWNFGIILLIAILWGVSARIIFNFIRTVKGKES
jgi:hypothetical protein